MLDHTSREARFALVVLEFRILSLFLLPPGHWDRALIFIFIFFLVFFSVFFICFFAFSTLAFFLPRSNITQSRFCSLIILVSTKLHTLGYPSGSLYTGR
jgi:hypothetical protein